MTTPTQRIALNAETQARLNAEIHKLIGGDKFVGLQKQGLWYRPNACGYTSCECDAGRFTPEEAKKREYLHGDFSEHVVIVPFTEPNYFSNDLPIKHRLEMLGCLTEGEWSCLVSSICHDTRKIDHHSEYWAEVIAIKFCLKMDQPTLALKVCEIKGGCECVAKL